MNNEPLRRQVRASLAPLTGQPFQYIGRAADLVWIGIGNLRATRVPSGRVESLAVHALHLQCPFRVEGPAGILIASGDLSLEPSSAGASEVVAPGVTTLFDQRSAEFSGLLPLTVEEVLADRSGGFALTLSGGYSMNVFPDTSVRIERWRYFRPSDEDSDFVVF